MCTIVAKELIFISLNRAPAYIICVSIQKLMDFLRGEKKEPSHLSFFAYPEK